ncbi:hypothetical protein V6B33_11480 [Mangrovibacillus sp. Mu-81]|uniref:hypothetical protein n=1 Tax=Mangrovibacillus sp. Mu-81 TaxID=3121478 RepID=UPI002FE4CA12
MLALCLSPLSEPPPLSYPQERMRRGGSRATRGKRSLARKSLAVFRVNTDNVRLPFSCYHFSGFTADHLVV